MHHGAITIGIDCRLSGPTHAGIGRYIENLLLHLPYDDSQWQWVLFFHNQDQTPQTPSFTQALNQGRVKIVITPIRHYSLAEQIKLPSIFNRYKLDVLHVPHFNVPIGLSPKQKLIITIHDLLWHEQRGSSVTTLSPWVYWLKYLGYRFVSRFAVHRAKHILVPSKTVANVVSDHYPNVASKITVTYEGVSEELKSDKKVSDSPTKNPAKTAKVAPKVHENTLLYVGSLYPHKNVSLVLQALVKLPEFKLEIAGSRSVFRDAIAEQAKKLGVEDQVIFLGFVPDHELVTKYQQSLALVQPSLSEGFGLTGLEAMAVGGAVLASDIAVFREIYQDGAVYFDPHQVDSFVAAVSELAHKRSTLVTSGQKIADNYSWQTMTDQTLTAYRQVVHES